MIPRSGPVLAIGEVTVEELERVTSLVRDLWPGSMVVGDSGFIFVWDVGLAVQAAEVAEPGEEVLPYPCGFEGCERRFPSQRAKAQHERRHREGLAAADRLELAAAGPPEPFRVVTLAEAADAAAAAPADIPASLPPITRRRPLEPDDDEPIPEVHNGDGPIERYRRLGSSMHRARRPRVAEEVEDGG